jgi:hypothetical protein
MRNPSQPEGFAKDGGSRGARSRTRSFRFGVGALSREDTPVGRSETRDCGSRIENDAIESIPDQAIARLGSPSRNLDQLSTLEARAA